MTNIYNQTFKLRTCDCDMRRLWKPSAILRAMQETAEDHINQLGLNHEKMLSIGAAWVVTRIRVEFTRMPGAGEEVLIETYPTSNRHFFFPRSHIFRDKNGAEIGRANSLWVTMDIRNRQIVKLEEVLAKMPYNGDMKMATGMPVTVRIPEMAHRSDCFPVQYTDLDENEHVNNTKYLDWCCNALGLEILRDRCVMSFDVNYDMEICLGSQVRTEIFLKENDFVFTGFVGDKKSFSVGGRLALKC